MMSTESLVGTGGAGMELGTSYRRPTRTASCQCVPRKSGEAWKETTDINGKMVGGHFYREVFSDEFHAVRFVNLLFLYFPAEKSFTSMVFNRNMAGHKDAVISQHLNIQKKSQALSQGLLNTWH